MRKKKKMTKKNLKGRAKGNYGILGDSGEPDASASFLANKGEE